MRLMALLAACMLAICALVLLPQTVRAAGRTEEVRLMAVPGMNGEPTVAPILNLKVAQQLGLPLLGGVSLHADWRHALDRGTWNQNRIVVGGTKPLFAGLDVTADYERYYNTNTSLVWVSVGMPFKF